MHGPLVTLSKLTDNALGVMCACVAYLIMRSNIDSETSSESLLWQLQMDYLDQMFHDLGREQCVLYESDAQIITLACHRFGIEAVEGSRKGWASVHDLVLVNEKCRNVLERLKTRYRKSECAIDSVPPKASLSDGTVVACPFGGLELMERGLRGDDAANSSSRDKLAGALTGMAQDVLVDLSPYPPDDDGDLTHVLHSLMYVDLRCDNIIPHPVDLECIWLKTANRLTRLYRRSQTLAATVLPPAIL